MINRIENAIAAIMAASIVIAPVTVTFYVIDYFITLVSIL